MYTSKFTNTLNRIFQAKAKSITFPSSLSLLGIVNELRTLLQKIKSKRDQETLANFFYEKFYKKRNRSHCIEQFNEKRKCLPCFSIFKNPIKQYLPLQIKKWEFLFNGSMSNPIQCVLC